MDKEKKFKYKNLKEVLLEYSTLALNQQKEILNNHFKIWKGNLDQVDDVTIIRISEFID